jgi:hypothetical protein
MKKLSENFSESCFLTGLLLSCKHISPKSVHFRADVLERMFMFKKGTNHT